MTALSVQYLLYLTPMVDQEEFIAQIEEILEHPQGIQVFPLELHMLLIRLREGGINFERFLAQAKAWVQAE